MQRTEDTFQNTKNFKALEWFYWTPFKMWADTWCKLLEVSEFGRGHLLRGCLLIRMCFWQKIHTWMRLRVLVSIFYTYPLAVAHCSADLFQINLMVGRQILLKGWTSPREPSFQERFIQQGEVAWVSSFRMRNRIDQCISRRGTFFWCASVVSNELKCKHKKVRLKTYIMVLVIITCSCALCAIHCMSTCNLVLLLFF